MDKHMDKYMGTYTNEHSANLGYIPVENIINNGDVIIGKVTPIQNDNSKKYKDSSKVYKSCAPGFVDSIYKKSANDGHDVRKMIVRTERASIIGDIFCQKK